MNIRNAHIDRAGGFSTNLIAPDKLNTTAIDAIPTSGLIPYARAKFAIEWAASLFLMIVLTPLIFSLGVLVKLSSPGPMFYSQIRCGRLGREFRIYKLRTMTHQCEMTTGPVWSTANDPRVTRVGRWLRDTHLDELPQLWNVIRGDMALIGPRPERPEIATRIEKSMPDFRKRLLVRPGITGLAQMRMPADTDLHAVRRKLAHDVHYIRNFGLAIDACVCLSTVFYFIGAAAKAVSKSVIQRYTPPDLNQSKSIMSGSVPPSSGRSASTFYSFGSGIDEADEPGLSIAA